MANGIWHDRFNFVILGVALIVLIPIGIAPIYLGLFVFGWLFSTLLFGPDTDIMPKKRTWLLGLLLYPYSLFSKHRGLSHHPLWGTLLRVIYGLLMGLLIIYILNEMGRIELTPSDMGTSIRSYFKGFNFKEEKYLYLVWTYLGLFLSDLCHLILDRF